MPPNGGIEMFQVIPHDGKVLVGSIGRIIATLLACRPVLFAAQRNHNATDVFVKDLLVRGLSIECVMEATVDVVERIGC